MLPSPYAPTRDAQTRTTLPCPHTCCGRRSCVRAATAGVHVAREASGHLSDRDMWGSVTSALPTLANAMEAVADASSPLLQHKSFIALGHQLRPLGPHDRRAVR